MYETSPGLGIDPLAPADERRILYEIIRTVSSTVDLEQVLEAVVKLIVEGVKAQSCFVWIVERGGRLVLRAASEQYADAVGVTTLAPGEGFAGWVSEHRQPIFIPSDALADPRARYFPEFEEEKYQSMVSVPLIAKDGGLFGVIGLHSLAPRTLTEDDATFVIHSASLVAGAIENARLYEATRRRVHELERLSEISDRAARATTLAELLPAVAEAACDLLDADQVCVYAVERGERHVRRAAAPAAGAAPPYLLAAAIADLPGAVTRGDVPAGAVALPLEVDGETLGHVVALRSSFAFDAGELDLLGTVAAQTAVGWKKIELIDGLTERNLTKDFFGDLASGRLDGAEGRARRLGCDLSSPRLAVVVLPHDMASHPDAERVAAVERFEAEVARELGGAVFDRRDDRCRGLVPVVGSDGATTGGAPPRRAREPAAGGRRLEPGHRRRGRRGGAGRGAPGGAGGARRHRARRRRDVRRARAVQVPAARAVAGRASATGTATRCGGWSTTTGSDGPSCAARSRSTWRGAATSPPRPRPCTCTRTRCASACAASRRSPASTCARASG